MNLLALSIYRYLVMPLAMVLLPFAAFANRKLSTGLKLRRQNIDALNSPTDPIWIHASSGEFEYAKAVIRELKSKHPAIPIVVTYFSPTFSRAAASFPGVDRAVALPLDLPGPCGSFLKKFHPRVALIARTDLWPEMLEQCRRRDIPVVLFSYTQKPARNVFKRFTTRWLLHWIKQIYCVSPDDVINLSSITPGLPAEVMGDTRYDQVAFRLNNPKPLPQSIHPQGDVPCLVAGSSWPEDEAVLLPAVSEALKAGSLRLILVPHEPTPDHLRAIERQLQQLSLSFTRYSSGQWDSEQVLVVDKVGVLAELYAFARFAFIGGSFRRSVHSVMEALGAGCITFVGPFHENNREAMEFKTLKLGSHPGLEAVNTSAEFKTRLKVWLDRPNEAKIFSAALKTEFTGRLGASRRLVHGIENLL